MIKAIGSLRGKKISDAFVGEGVPIIIFSDGSFISVWQDDEQNGPGSIRWCSKGKEENAVLVDDSNKYLKGKE